MLDFKAFTDSFKVLNLEAVLKVMFCIRRKNTNGFVVMFK